MDKREQVGFIEYLRGKYRRARKGEKSVIIDEVSKKLQVSRKHASRLLAAQAIGRPRKPERRGRPSKYQRHDFKQALRKLWQLQGYICGRALKGSMLEWVRALEAEDGAYDPVIRQLLLQVSPATIDRALREYKTQHGKSYTRSGGFREEIPIQENVWDIAIPGYLEADTVAHCGGSMAGEFAWSFSMVDIASLWTETRAVFGRGSTPVVQRIEEIERTLPFTIRGYDADNGTEVLNQHILRYFQDERVERGKPPVTVTRSREYRKNDNAHIEQRNNTIPRMFLGYERIDFPQIVPLINHYYQEVVCPLINHFRASFKLHRKIRKKSCIRRVYLDPVAPYYRIINSPHVSDAQKRALMVEHNHLNPVRLARAEVKMRRLIDTVLKALRATDDVAGTLLQMPRQTRFQISGFSDPVPASSAHLPDTHHKLSGT